MKLGLIADIHDNLTNLDGALAIFEGMKVREVLVLGDMCSPPTVQRLVDSGLTFWCIYGNNDGDRVRMMKVAAGSKGRVTLAEDEFAEYEFGGQPVFATHYPQIAALAAETAQYRAVFYGHDHIQHWESLSNGTVLANPGEIWGYKTGVASWGVWDSETNEVEIFEL